MKVELPVAKSKVWRLPGLHDLELLHAEHLTQAFPRHTHEHYAVGVIERGALGFFYRGENVVAATGDINLCIPGEVHTGHPAVPGGWSYRMFYLDARFLQKVAADIADKPRRLPFFRSGVVTDGALAQSVHSLHRRLEQTSTPLEQETLLLDMVAQLIVRHADEPLSAAGVAREPYAREPHAVTQVKDYLEAHYAEVVSLERLSLLTHLSRYHLVRVFRKAVGVPPHAYLRQVRVRRAKELLSLGRSPAEVALMTGFTDQSHLTRWFKRLWGYTPGQYRNPVQDSSVLD